MKAISIRQPWAWAICHAGKRCENRSWEHAPSYRGPLLIHASKGCTMDEYESAALGIALDFPRMRNDIPELFQLPRGAVVARARLVDVHDQKNTAGHRYSIDKGGGCVGCGYVRPAVAELVAGGYDPGPFVCPKPDPWAIPGAFGLILADVVPFAQPVPFKGMLGFFEVPDALLQEVPS